MGGMVTLYPLCRLSGTFFQNNFGTIPIVFENKEISWKHKFLSFKSQIKSTKNETGEEVSRNLSYLSRVLKPIIKS